MDRKIKCINDDDYSLTFGSDKFSPFVIMDCEGIYQVLSDVKTSDNGMSDGSTYLASTLKLRNIVLTVAFYETYQNNRELLYKIFKPKSLGTFIYEENNKFKQIKYVVENINISTKGKVRVATMSLLCPDPYFQSLNETVVTMSSWVGQFIFQHKFKKEPFGRFVAQKLKAIDNDSTADNIGLKIEIKVDGEVVNPKIIHVEDDKFIKIGTSRKRLTLNVGDTLIISTEQNNKNVELISGGSKRKINEYLDEASDFIQLRQGRNSLRYEAEQGEQYMRVSIYYRSRFLGI